MSFPTEFDFALIKMGDGSGSEVFVALCGVQDVTVNRVAQTSDRYARDCAKPGSTPVRKVKTTGKSLTITGSGLSNADTVDEFEAALGKSKNYKIEGYRDDGTDTGALLGTFAGAFVLTAANLNVARDSASSGELTIENNGPWTWAAAS